MSLFGNATASAANTGGSLFGNINSNSNTNTTQTPSLFGSTTNQPAAGGTPSLFGNSTAQPATGTTSSLFGTTTNQTAPANNTTSLFGNTTNQAAPATNTSSLFGNTSNTQQQQQQPQQTNNGSSLFGSLQQPQANNGSSLFGSSQQPQNAQANQQQQLFAQSQATQLQAGLGSSSMLGSLTAAQQQDLARSRLQQYGIDHRTNTKTIFDQTKTLISKWDPNSQDTLMQGYLYNAVNAAYAPFYHRNADEDEKSWETALAEKPTSSIGSDGQAISYVPVLVRGFKALGERIEVQVNTVNQMRLRLHEMNNCLASIMSAHQQRISVKIEGAKRQHTVLSQRCLRLAVKVQVLRNRGYALDANEEVLRKMLLGLEKQVMNPEFLGREEEVWARMVVLRERSRWLEEEGKKLGQQVKEQEQAGLPEEVLAKTRKILSDYDNQLSHLGRELEVLKKEYADWDAAQPVKAAARS